MKAVTLHTARPDILRQWNKLRDCRLPTVEARIEASDLWHVRELLEGRLDRGQVVRLMERRKWYQLPQFLKRLGRDAHWMGVSGPAMNDPMTNAERACASVLGVEPL